jgi:pimeloyl-ACP methyl ester carboxylesterase
MRKRLNSGRYNKSWSRAMSRKARPCIRPLKGWTQIAALISSAPPLRPLPMILLSADRAWGPQIPSMIAAGELPTEVPADFGYVVDAAQKEPQERLAKLVPQAKYVPNTNSGHEVHKEQPQLVIDAIREVVEAVRCVRPLER